VPPVLVDSNVILDVFQDDPEWADWSDDALHSCSGSHDLCINPIVYSEVSVGFDRIEDLEAAVEAAGFLWLEVPREALFLAGKAFLSYRRRQGTRVYPLPDFYIGAHAAVSGLDLLTRDAARYRTYFPSVRLITPTES
jgi:predicted nucleic acid-binding protein